MSSDEHTRRVLGREQTPWERKVQTEIVDPMAAKVAPGLPAPVFDAGHRETPRRIPVDGALAALRVEVETLMRDAPTPLHAYTPLLAAVECLAMAIEQAQSAERAAHPLHVVTSDASIEARAQAAYEAWSDAEGAPCGGRWQAVVRAVDASRPDPEHARVTMTPLDRLRVIAGLVMTLPHGKASHEVAFGHDEPAFTMLCESGANVTRNDLGDVGIILRATLHIDGVRFTAQKDGEGVST